MNDKMIEAARYRGHRNPSNPSVPISMASRDFTLLRAKVKYIDLERFVMTCEVFFTSQIITDVAIAMPFAGPMSFISGMPEVNSIVILAKAQEVYFPIAYLPAYSYGIQPQFVKSWPESVQAKENDTFYKHRKLRPGEINLGSAQGAELFLSYDITLENEYGDNIIIRNADHSILSTSMSNNILSSGVLVNAGVITRNMLEGDNTAEGHFAVKHTLRDGRIAYQLRPENQTALSKYYSEYLIEVEDQGSSEMPSNSANNMVDIDPRNPVAILSMGNFVGNNSAKPDTYGKMLGVSLFTAHDATEGSFQFKNLTKDEPEKFGLAAMIYAPDRHNYEQGAILAIDKEGHFYQYLPAATGGGISNGRSMSLLARGNKKEIWGAESILGNSWDTLLEGGLKWRIGSHNNKDYDLRNTSMDIVTKGKVYFQYGDGTTRSVRDFDQDDKLVQNIDKYRKIEKIAGSERKELTGSRETIIEGNDQFRIKGMKREVITGFYNSIVGGNRNVNVGDTSSFKVTNEGQESFGSKKIECTKGNHALTIFSTGDITETINIRGNRSTRITSGNISESITTLGDKSFQTTTGNYKVNVLSVGNVTHKTTAGSIVAETKAGKMDHKATLGITLTSQALAKMEGLKIQLKTPFPTSKIVTKLTSTCFITGAMNTGNPMAEA